MSTGTPFRAPQGGPGAGLPRAICRESSDAPSDGVMNTRIKLDDVNGTPTVLLTSVPSPLRVGDPLGLRFRIRRTNAGRAEVLEVHGQFRVSAIGFDLSVQPRRQLVTVEAVGKPPTWVSVKRAPPRAPLAPAISPRTPVM